MIRVVVYGRRDCHLCDEAIEMIEVLVGESDGPIEVREVDIEADDRLLRDYLERIPVIEVDGVLVSELVPDPQALRMALLHTSPR